MSNLKFGRSIGVKDLGSLGVKWSAWNVILVLAKVLVLTVTLQNQDLSRSEHFRKDLEIADDVTHKSTSGWIKWWSALEG